MVERRGTGAVDELDRAEALLAEIESQLPLRWLASLNE